MMRIRRKDKVRVISGKDKGKEGEILRVLSKEGKVLVSGVNIVHRHLKSREGRKGGIVEVERPLDVSKVSLVCGQCRNMAKIGFKKEGNKKVRFCRGCQGVL